MIVVIGNPVATTSDPGIDGPAVRTALAAARASGQVELVGKAGDDADGEAIVLALARTGIGHAALLRDPARRTPRIVGTPEADVLLDADEGAPAAPEIEPADPLRRPTLEAADVELALRYLPDVRVIVVADAVAPEIVAAAAEAAGYAGAHLVVLGGDGTSLPDIPTGSLVLAGTGWDPDWTMTTLVGEYAAAVDAGAAPSDAYGRLRGRISGAAPGAG